MTPEIRQRYMRLRTTYPGAPATCCLRWARDETPQHPIDWTDGRGRALLVARWKQDGFSIRAEVHYDEGGTVDWLGEFDRHYRSGAISVPAPRTWRESRVWFVPMTSYAEHYTSLRKDHGRQEAHELARQYVLADAKRLRDYADGELALLALHVTVSRGNVELGSASLHGIDVDSPRDAYMAETARELANEAISEAQAAVRRVCSDNWELPA